MRNLVVLMLALSLISVGVSARTIKQLYVVPSSWKMENYFSDILVVFFSGSVCENGRLSFPDNATISDKNRFWSSVLAARASSSRMFVRYDSDDTSCAIVSFGVNAE